MQNSIPQTVHPSPNDKREVAKLWKEVFNDSDEFIKLFFDCVYKPENTFVIKRNGSIVSALQIIPYDFKYNEKIAPCAYICGVCTHPSERGQGLMKRLMNYTLPELEKRGFCAAIVIPAELSLFDYYKKFGFVYPIYRQCKERTIKWSGENVPYTFESCTIEHFPYFNDKQHKRKRTVLLSENDYTLIIKDLILDGGGAYVALKNNMPTGMVFAKKISKETVLIKSLLSDDRKTYSALYKYIAKRFDSKNVLIYTPVTNHRQADNNGLYGLVYKFNNQNINTNLISLSLMLD